MIISNLSKLFIPTLMVVSSTLIITGCDLFDNDDDNTSDDDPYVAPPDPIVAPPVPTDGITGIWTGSFAWTTTGQSKDYDVTMMFHTPDGADEGISGGAAFDTIDTDPAAQFLFEGGYQYYTDPIESIPVDTDTSKIVCDGDVWAVGRFGTKGTFIQEFDYETGSAAGPDQRGSGCLYLRDVDGDGYKNELTGDIAFEDGGKFTVSLTYSTENVRPVTVSDFGIMGTDDIEYHLWSNDNSGSSMSYTSGGILADTLVIAIVESHPTATCGSDVTITKVPDHNLFTVNTVDPHVLGCSISGAFDVNLQYTGLGALFDLDNDGNLEFVHLMASSGGGIGATAQALYNHFTIQ